MIIGVMITNLVRGLRKGLKLEVGLRRSLSLRTPSTFDHPPVFTTTAFDRLDKDCLATILSFLPPVEICAAATVCTAWRDASRLDIAWARVASGFESALAPATAKESPALANLNAANARERAHALVTRGICLDDKMHLHLNRRTKAVQLSFSAKE